MTVWTWLWLAWLVAFAVLEGYTIRSKRKGDTLSETTRRWFGTNTKLGRMIWIASFGLFAAWFVVHIAVAGSA